MKNVANRLLNLAVMPRQYSAKNRQDFRQAANFILDNYEEISHMIVCDICGHVSYSDVENTAHFETEHMEEK